MASSIWALIDSAYTLSFADLPLRILAMTVYACFFSGIFCLLHASLMEAIYLKFPPPHPLPIAVSTFSGFLAGAALSLLIIRDSFALAIHDVPLAIIGAVTGFLLGLSLARAHQKSSRKQPTSTAITSA